MESAGLGSYRPATENQPQALVALQPQSKEESDIMTSPDQAIATFYSWIRHFIGTNSREPVDAAGSIRQIARKKGAN